MNFFENQKVTRRELTALLCQEEIKSGLVPTGGLMQVSIIEGRFLEYTNLKLRIEWTDDLCKTGVVKSAYSFTAKDQDYLNSLATIDTTEYEED